MVKVEAVIFDWAGTLIDFGSRAPVDAFIETFDRFGVAVSVEEVRGPMGAAKRDHIKAMLFSRLVCERWATVHGKLPNDEDVDRLYSGFLPISEAVAAQTARPVPGAAQALAALRKRGLKLGSTTGYTRSIMTQVLAEAAQHNIILDCVVCADEVIHGRPAPCGIEKNLTVLGVSRPEAVVKVDDTVIGIKEGTAAGCMSVGVSLCGNLVGKTEAELNALPSAELARLKRKAERELTTGGATAVIDTVADLPELIDRLEGRSTSL